MRKIKILSIIVLSLLAIIACRKKDINNLKNDVKDLQTRVTILENLCKQNNTNINSLQTLVNTSITQNDYITNVTPVTKEDDEVGYTISFTNQTPITIYNGKDGQDGDDGVSPIIGVKMDSDSIYYWTLNGEWLLNDSGKKMRVTGNDGANGQNGTNGNDGITPKLKVEDENWFVSYDDGETWNFVSSAKGEKGDKGDNGDSMFKSVTSDELYVYFTLADDSVLKIQKATEVYSRTEIDSLISIINNQINNLVATGTVTEKLTIGTVTKVGAAIQAPFSINATSVVYFSQGNLQYQASTNIWKFAENQYEIIGENNSAISSTNSNWIDLFGWATSGWNNGNTYYNPYDSSNDAGETSSTSTATGIRVVTHTYNSGYGPLYKKNFTFTTSGDDNADWGIYNPISNAENESGKWRTLTKEEWNYIFNTRTNAAVLYSQATVNEVEGLIILPDNWPLDKSINFTPKASEYKTNTYSLEEWNIFESNGAIFLPAAGKRDGTVISSIGESGLYWTSSDYYDTQTSTLTNATFIYNYYNACAVEFGTSGVNLSGFPRYYGYAVRLVQDIE